MPPRNPTQAAFVGRLLQFLPQLSREMTLTDRKHFTQGEVTLPQFWTLEHLQACSLCTMHALAARLRLQGSTTTGLVDQLTRRGLVLRRRGRTDRREVYVALTARGRRAMEHIRRHKRQTLRRWFSRFSPAERATFLNSMDKLQLGLAAGRVRAARKEQP